MGRVRSMAGCAMVSKMAIKADSIICFCHRVSLAKAGRMRHCHFMAIKTEFIRMTLFTSFRADNGGRAMLIRPATLQVGQVYFMASFAESRFMTDAAKLIVCLTMFFCVPIGDMGR